MEKSDKQALAIKRLRTRIDRIAGLIEECVHHVQTLHMVLAILETHMIPQSEAKLDALLALYDDEGNRIGGEDATAKR